jgi:hypothetical protein
MAIHRLAMPIVASVLLSACACKGDWAYFPDTLPFHLPGVPYGAHLSETQAQELAVAVAIHHRTNPANFASPQATYDKGEWHVYFGEGSGPVAPAFGSHFSVYIYERSNNFSFSAGR